MRLICVVFLLYQFNLITYAQEPKTFRKDYRYFDSTKSFYKIHEASQTWEHANKICESEGSSLFYPENEFESEVVAYYVMNDKGITSTVFIGRAQTDQELPSSRVGFDDDLSIDEPLVHRYCKTFDSNGRMRDEDCDSKHSFVCKKALSSLKWDPICNMPDLGYKYNEALGHCYKFHKDQMNWINATAECEAEMSYLSVVNSQLEATTLVNISRASPKNKIIPVPDLWCGDQILLGFHKTDSEGWITIQGVPLTQSGYSAWLRGEPNGGLYGGEEENCGTMFYSENGQLNDIGCQHMCPFICEHDIDRSNVHEENTTPNY